MYDRSANRSDEVFYEYILSLFDDFEEDEITRRLESVNLEPLLVYGREVGDNEAVGLAAFALGITALNNNRKDEAAILFAESSVANEDIGDLDGAMISQILRARSLNRLPGINHLDETTGAYVLTLAMAEEAGDEIIIQEANLALAELATKAAIARGDVKPPRRLPRPYK